ncbi:DUF3106 domain-containing protein [Acinetobacter sp. MD2(2019)]|uniref:DUF3106 domain-containing protein n=1 Tax=Acinetobacter sp. MD2(2019) TaxID=2605273 RepID=UPI002D1EBE39|nr:DUF3106 domain-containing protein [Acinetobacter sp. MD2(2019)]MEB3753479.1 DUF3106 domain-containing protein [Acinetobacter sp. MD2(2019)]
MAAKKWMLGLCSLMFLQTGFAAFENFWPFSSKTTAASTVDDNWSDLSTDQRKQVLQRYQNLKDISNNQSSSLQSRMDWFTQLPEQEQQKMREAWQQMSTQQRNEMRSRMQKAKTVDERNSIRQEYLQKFQSLSTDQTNN